MLMWVSSQKQSGFDSSTVPSSTIQRGEAKIILYGSMWHTCLSQNEGPPNGNSSLCAFLYIQPMKKGFPNNTDAPLRTFLFGHRARFSSRVLVDPRCDAPPTRRWRRGASSRSRGPKGATGGDQLDPLAGFMVFPVQQKEDSIRQVRYRLQFRRKTMLCLESEHVHVHVGGWRPQSPPITPKENRGIHPP